MKTALTGESFIAALQNSAIYRSLPTPASQPAILKPLRRLGGDLLLQACVQHGCFAAGVHQQTFPGSFEVLVWNNNYEAREEIERLYDKYKTQLDLKVIHSTENFYCVIRLAIASLIRSDFILDLRRRRKAAAGLHLAVHGEGEGVSGFGALLPRACVQAACLE